MNPPQPPDLNPPINPKGPQGVPDWYDGEVEEEYDE